MIRRILLPLLPLLLAVCSAAQTATFTWTGNTDPSTLIELATINGAPINQASGYAGAIQIVNQKWLWLLELPEDFNFPNNGFLACESLLTFGPKQWGTRADGTTMDGTRGGDSYNITATTTCAQWNGTTNITLNEFRMFITHHSCGRYRCTTYLLDTAESGTGTAVVE